MSEDTASADNAPEATNSASAEPSTPDLPVEKAAEVFDPEKHRENLRKVSVENSNLKKRMKELEPIAAKFRELEEASKSEAQKLAERLATTEQELSASKSTTIRLFAAATHNIPADLIDLLGTGTEEEIDARAKLLAAKLAPAPPAEEQAPPAPGSQRPVESLRPGASPQTGADPNDPNAWIRDYVNRGR